jgi:hypothetical protein
MIWIDCIIDTHHVSVIQRLRTEGCSDRCKSEPLYLSYHILPITSPENVNDMIVRLETEPDDAI